MVYRYTICIYRDVSVCVCVLKASSYGLGLVPATGIDSNMAAVKYLVRQLAAETMGPQV